MNGGCVMLLSSVHVLDKRTKIEVFLQGLTFIWKKKSKLETVLEKKTPQESA